MSNETKPPAKNAVHYVLFLTAINFKSEQEHGITFVDKPKEVGKSYMGTLIPERLSIEVRMYRNGQPAMDDGRHIVRNVPLSYVQQYEMA